MPNADREDERRDRQLERGREAPRELLEHGAAGLDGRAEVARQQLAEPGEVLLDERPVEAVELVDPLDRLGCRLLTEQGDGGPAGQRAHPEEQQDRQTEQGGDQQEQPACRWCAARRSPGDRATSVSRAAAEGVRMPRPRGPRPTAASARSLLAQLDQVEHLVVDRAGRVRRRRARANASVGAGCASGMPGMNSMISR